MSMGFLRNSLWFGAGRACVCMNNWTGFACCRCDPPDCIKTLHKSWIPSIYVHIYICVYICICIFIYCRCLSISPRCWNACPSDDLNNWTGFASGTSGDLSTTFRWGPSRDPPEISQDPFESLENTALADAGALQGPSRDSPGTPWDFSMDADRLPVGMVAFGSVACRTGCLWLGSMYYRNTISHIHTYIYIYICIYVST